MKCPESTYPFTCEEPVKCELDQGHAGAHEAYNGADGVFRWSAQIERQEINVNVELTKNEINTAIAALSRNYRRLTHFQAEYERKYVAGQPGYVKRENDALLKEVEDIKALHEKLAKKR